MRIGILGSGPAALYSALLIKEKHPEYLIDIFEKEEKFAKKLRATGNGHANIMPSLERAPTAYNDPSFMASFLDKYPLPQRKEAFKKMGVALMRKEGQGYYPASDNANQFASYLLEVALSKGVALHNLTRVADYAKRGGEYFFVTSQGEKGPYDTLLLAPGALSGKNLGSDGSFIKILKAHGYHLDPFRPGLTPVRLHDDVKGLAGVRHNASLSVYEEGKRIFSEQGEILYKEDGLSGIVTMNASSVIARKNSGGQLTIQIDLFPEYALETLIDEMNKIHDAAPSSFLDAFLPHPLATHVIKRAKRMQDVEYISSLAIAMKGLRYAYKENYGFPFSQVSVGGLLTNQLSPSFESKIEKTVYFAGEIINIDGVCGGYNLLFDLLNAMAIADSL